MPYISHCGLPTVGHVNLPTIPTQAPRGQGWWYSSLLDTLKNRACTDSKEGDVVMASMNKKKIEDFECSGRAEKYY